MLHARPSPERRRLVARQCGAVELRASATVEARARLRAVVYSCGLSVRECATILGVNPRTLERQLSGARKAGKQRAQWYRRLLRLSADDDTVTIVLQRVGRTREYLGLNKKTLRLVGASPR